MANITFNNQTTGFAMWQSEITPKGVDVASSYVNFSTPNKYIVTLEGGPFSSLNGIPTSGNVEAVGIYFPGKASGPDISITGLDVDVTVFKPAFTAATAEERTTAFWTAALGGNDVINFGTTATGTGYNITFAGDGYNAPADGEGGNDVLRGDVAAGLVSGDYLGALVDRSAFGGNDDIRLTNSLGATVVGDFYTDASSRLFAGDDYIQLGDYAGTAYGDMAALSGVLEAGNDTIIGGAGGDILVGDVATANATATFKAGNDEIHGGGGADSIYGDYGSAQNAAFRAGDDRLSGDAGNDTIAGNGGDDHLDGGSDNDVLIGGEGNDVLRGGTGMDSIFGSGGIDTADYRGTTQKVAIALDNNGSGTTKVGGVSEDKLDDIENLIGGLAGDKLVGNPSENRLEGAGGNDTLNGGSDSDTLVGGKGKDKLIGGSEADQFVFNARLGSTNIDKIVDFLHGVDEIALDDAIFKALGTSFERNEFVAKVDGHAATKTSQHVIYDKSDGTLWYDVDGRGGKAAVQFAQLGSEANHPTTLSWDDFSIV